MRLWRALTRKHAETAPDAEDPALRGRTYAIPFDRVWSRAARLAGGGRDGGGLPRWSVVRADDQEGVLKAVAESRLPGRVSDVTVRICLDHNAQTRVDAMARSRKGRADLGASRRRLVSFFRALDEALEAPEAPEAPERTILETV